MPSSPPLPALTFDAAPVPAALRSARTEASAGLQRIARLAARHAQVPCVQVVFLDPDRSQWNLSEGSLAGVIPDAATLYAGGHLTDGIEVHRDLHAHDRWLTLSPPEARFFAGFVCHHTTERGIRPLAALCLWDAEPRVLRPDHAAFLSELAAALAAPLLHFESEARRLRAEARLSRIAEATPDALVLASPDRRIRAVNPAFERLFGYTHGEIAGQRTEVLYADPADHDEQGCLRCNPDAGSDAKEHERAYRVTYRRKDGSTFVGETVGVKIDDGADGFLGLVRDVTPQQEAEATLRQARDEAEAAAHLIRTSLANINRELRAPLADLLGCAEWLLHEAPPDLHQPLRLIRQSSIRLKTTLDSILDLARIGVGEMPVSSEQFVPEHVLHEVIDELQDVAEDQALGLRFDPAAPAQVAKGSAVALGRIATHLITNALKFTEEGHVEVALEALPEGLRLRVRDTGPGIDPAFLPHVFDAFEHESDGWTRTHDGIGIGLTIAHRLVRLVGGTIDVASTRGVGSTFTVELPCAWLTDDDAPERLPSYAEVRFLKDAPRDTVEDTRDEDTLGAAHEDAGEQTEAAPVAPKPSHPSGPTHADRRAEVSFSAPVFSAPAPMGVPPAASRAAASGSAASGPLAQPTSVLVADAAETVCSLVGAYLMGICEVHTATTLADALDRAEERPFDLLLLATDLAEDEVDSPAALLAQLRSCAGTADAFAVALTADAAFEAAAHGFEAALRKPLDDTEVLLTVGAALAG